MGLKAKLNLILGAIFAATVIAFGFAGAAVVKRFFRVAVVETNGGAMARALASPCAALLRAKDDPERKKLYDFLKDQRDPALPRDAVLGSEVDVLSIAVVDDSRTVVAAIPNDRKDELEKDPVIPRALAADDVIVDGAEGPQRFGPRGEAVMVFAVPLREQPRAKAHGVLWFQLSLERAQTLYQATLFGLLGIGLTLALGLWVAIYTLLKSSILAPILELSRATERVRAGDLTARIGGSRRDELGSLIRSFDEMVGFMRDRIEMAKRLDDAERLAEAHRRLEEIHRELAEAHLAQQQMQEALILTEKHASLGRLVRGVAHEINNPLGAAANSIPPLRAALERLRAATAKTDGALPPELQEDLKDVEIACDVISRGVSRAVAIVRDLRAFSRLGSVDLATVDLARTIQEAADATAAERGDRVKVEPDVQGKIELKAFPTLLLQVLVNLITNATQAIQAKGATGTIKVSARVRGDRVRIEVKDDGPGIKPEHLQRLFEPFFTTKEAGRGTGLGLALCHGIIEKHGGTIDAQSEVGKGATFMIELPLEVRVDATAAPTASALFEGRARDSVAAVATKARLG